MLSRMILDLDAAARPLAEGLGLPPVSSGGAEARLRSQAVPTWLMRMKNEQGSARVFEALSAHAGRLGCGALADELAGFAHEERRHGLLCAAVVVALGGRAVSSALPAAPYPEHADATSPLEALLRNVMAVSCLAETVAVALIGAELDAMPAGPLAELLRLIWSDEVGHSRAGWRFVHAQAPRLPAAGRASLGRYLTQALGELERHEQAHLPIAAEPPPGGARYGLCSGSSARELMQRVIADVIVPQLAVAGIEPEEIG
jgi:hypothetical protein